MKIVKTTDNLHIGVNIEIPSDIKVPIKIGDFEFVIQNVTHLENSNTLLSNPNYQIELEE